MNDRIPDFEDELRERLQREAAGIEPTPDGLERIRERIDATPTRRSRRSWLLASSAGLTTAALVVGALYLGGSLGDRSAAPQPQDGGPPVSATPTPPPSATPTAPSTTPTEPSVTPTAPAPDGTRPTDSATEPGRPGGVAEQAVPVYYPGATDRGERLFREWHRVSSTDDVAVVALRQMFSVAPDDPDYHQPWQSGVSVLGVTHDDGLITVDLSPEVLRTRTGGEVVVQSLVYTVQAALGSTDPVRLLAAGEPVGELAGVPVPDPIRRASALDVQALTWITEPEQGATVDPTFTVRGVANHFEATVNWQLLSGDEVVREGHTMAAEGQRFTPYEFRVRDVAPGSYTVKVFEYSAKDGSQVAVDTKTVTVR